MSGNRPEILSEETSEAGKIVTARIVVGLAQGGQAEILRRWRFDAVGCAVSLEDRLTNIGESSFPPMLMYHMNIGAHLFDEQTRLSGASFEGGTIGWRFGEGEGKVFCVPAITESDGRAHVSLGPIEAIGGKALHVWFATDSIPHLQMWRNQAGHRNVLGIEPVSHPWKTRSELEALGLLPHLAPGESRTYRLGFAFR
jgi:hypothetical protein